MYADGAGDILIQPEVYPVQITDYLDGERMLLDLMTKEIDVVVEIGAMHGRHLEWAVNRNIAYVGIDPVQRYIDRGIQAVVDRKLDPRRYQFKCGVAERVSEILPSGPIARAFLFFPFNSFGNMLDVPPVFEQIKKTGHSFLISTFDISKEATGARREYYERCGFHGLECHEAHDSVSFTSDDGFRSVAYRPSFLLDQAASVGIDAVAIKVASIGMAYASSDAAGVLV